MTTYFGQETGETDGGGWGFSVWYKNKTFQCPGSGTQIVVELSIYTHVDAGSPNTRIALFDSNGNLVCQGSSERLITGTTYSWQGHLTASVITPNPATLVGGASYRPGISFDGNASNSVTLLDSSTHTSGDIQWKDPADYTGGWGSTMPAGTNGDIWSCVRVGVNPAGMATPSRFELQGKAKNELTTVTDQAGSRRVLDQLRED